MGVITYESEDVSPVPAALLFKALFFESEKHLPKAMPGIIKSVEVVEGDGGPGTIKKVTYVRDGEVTYAKYKFEEIDKANLKISFTIFEGDHVGNNVEKISCDHTYVPSPNGGSICKSIVKVYTKVDFELPEHFQPKANIKPFENYLLANPQVCN